MKNFFNYSVFAARLFDCCDGLNPSCQNTLAPLQLFTITML